MGLTSRERVSRAIHFGTPDRLPFMSDDVHRLSPNFRPERYRDQGLERVYDEWGCLWVRSELRNMGQCKGHPLEDWDAIDTYEWPDPNNPAYYANLEDDLAGAGDKYVLVGMGLTLYERMWFLHGLENVLTGLYAHRDRMELLADRIVGYTRQVIENVGRQFPGRIHGVVHTDDWGTQLATFISPKTWIEFFQPRYARIFEADHAQGWDTWLHSDGRINEIVGPWREAGLDAINMPAPRMVGIDEIGRRYAGEICFFGGVDNQLTLPFEGREEIRREAQLLLTHWATPKGGFIAQGWGNATDDQLEVYNLPKWAVQCADQAFRDFDPYHD